MSPSGILARESPHTPCQSGVGTVYPLRGDSADPRSTVGQPIGRTIDQDPTEGSGAPFRGPADP